MSSEKPPEDNGSGGSEESSNPNAPKVQILTPNLKPEIQQIIAHLHVYNHLTENEVDKLLKVYQALEVSSPDLAKAWITEALATGQHKRDVEKRVLELASEEIKNDRIQVIGAPLFSAFVILLIVGLVAWLAFLHEIKLAVSVIGIATTAIGLSRVLAARKNNRVTLPQTTQQQARSPTGKKGKKRR